MMAQTLSACHRKQSDTYLSDARPHEGVLDAGGAAHEDNHEGHDLLQLQAFKEFGRKVPHKEHQLTQVVHKVLLQMQCRR